MENPARQTMRAMGFVILGIMIGFVPGVIRVDQMRREVKSTTVDTANQITELRGKLMALVSENQMTEQRGIDRSKYHTLLISNFGPVPHRDFLGVEEPWTHLDVSLIAGTIWVIPGLVQPHTLMPDQRAAWAVVDPQGHTGRWSQVPASDLNSYSVAGGMQ